MEVCKQFSNILWKKKAEEKKQTLPCKQELVKLMEKVKERAVSGLKKKKQK